MPDILSFHVHNAALLECYGALLTESQRAIYGDYYNFDLSLSEVASSRGVSRSAVEDSLKKSTAKLEEFEKKLGYLKKKEELKEKYAKAVKKGDYEELGEYINHGI